MTEANDSIVLIDATSSSLTVSWPESDGSDKYILEYKPASADGSSDNGNGNEENDGFLLLSDKLGSTQARKRNLGDNGVGSYWFRARGAEADGTQWRTHSTAFQLLSDKDEADRMGAPTAIPAGTNQALLISWKESSAASSSFELQMRPNQGGAPWTTIAAQLSGTSVRKKNLTDPHGYQFRVRPSASDASFSAPCDPVVARGLSVGIQRFFGSLQDKTLVRNAGADLSPVALADALGGKEFVLLYASAHWCPPCRKFTPMLAQWYQSHKTLAEVVFLSCDHDESGFRSYFRTSHPWLAVDYDDDAREKLLAAIQVKGIPRLVVMSGISGKIIEQNAVGQPLDVNRWRALAASAK